MDLYKYINILILMALNILLLFVLCCTDKINPKQSPENLNNSDKISKEEAARFFKIMIETEKSNGEKKEKIEKKLKLLSKRLKTINDKSFKSEILYDIYSAFRSAYLTKKAYSNFDPFQFENIKNTEIIEYTGVVEPFTLDDFIIKIDNIFDKIDKGLNRRKFSFITWNIWFSSYSLKNRIERIMSKIHELNADFIAFQEVTRESLAIIKENKGKYKLYGEKDIYNNTNKKGYDTLILSKFDCKDIERKIFKNSSQGRNKLKCKFKVKISKDKFININIFTYHLESLFEKQYYYYKLEQFDIIKKDFSENDYTIMMGDTNFLKIENNPSLPKYISDAFIAIGSPKDLNYTYNGNENSLVSKDKNGKTYPPARFDRIYFTNENFKINHFKIIGKPIKPIKKSPEIKEIKPSSDHYGIYCVFELK